MRKFRRAVSHFLVVIAKTIYPLNMLLEDNLKEVEKRDNQEKLMMLKLAEKEKTKTGKYKIN